MFGSVGKLQIGTVVTGSSINFDTKEQALSILPILFDGPTTVDIHGKTYMYDNGKLTEKIEPKPHNILPLKAVLHLCGSVKGFKYGYTAGDIRMIWRFSSGIHILIYKDGIYIPGDGDNIKSRIIPEFDVNCFQLSDTELLGYLFKWDPTYSCAIGGSLITNIQHLIVSKPNVGNVFESEECVICMDSAPTETLRPCQHKCLCLICSGKLKSAQNLMCPLCRNPVLSL